MGLIGFLEGPNVGALVGGLYVGRAVGGVNAVMRFVPLTRITVVIILMTVWDGLG